MKKLVECPLCKNVFKINKDITIDETKGCISSQIQKKPMICKTKKKSKNG
jgi:uncharacterized C2H2 Zn-finger protein